VQSGFVPNKPVDGLAVPPYNFCFSFLRPRRVDLNSQAPLTSVQAGSRSARNLKKRLTASGTIINQKAWRTKSFFLIRKWFIDQILILGFGLLFHREKIELE
jgi:hypothetical protein